VLLCKIDAMGSLASGRRLLVFFALLFHVLLAVRIRRKNIFIQDGLDLKSGNQTRSMNSSRATISDGKRDDSTGPYLRSSSYVGWRDDAIFTSWVEKFIFQAQHVVGSAALRLAQQRKDERDGTLVGGASEYHITLCGSFDEKKSGGKFASLSEFLVDARRKLSVSQASPLGMGLLREPNGNFALMLIVEWPELQTLRRQFDLEPNHPHITVGFRDQDIHNQVKDRTALIISGREHSDVNSVWPKVIFAALVLVTLVVFLRWSLALPFNT
jgi:hypothetical protein